MGACCGADKKKLELEKAKAKASSPQIDNPNSILKTDLPGQVVTNGTLILGVDQTFKVDDKLSNNKNVEGFYPHNPNSPGYLPKEQVPVDERNKDLHPSTSPKGDTINVVSGKGLPTSNPIPGQALIPRLDAPNPGFQQFYNPNKILLKAPVRNQGQISLSLAEGTVSVDTVANILEPPKPLVLEEIPKNLPDPSNFDTVVKVVRLVYPSTLSIQGLTGKKF